VTKINFIRQATRVMLGKAPEPVANRTLDIDYVGVKAAQFSFRRLSGADPLLGVEMASTGEVACFGDDIHEALLKSLISTGFRRPGKGVLLAIGTARDKEEFVEYARILAGMGLAVYATAGTAAALIKNGIECDVVFKFSEQRSPSTIDIIRSGEVDLVINIPEGTNAREESDGFHLRRRAIDQGVFLVTNLQLAKALVNALSAWGDNDLKIKSWREYATV
jgi:carbamoyl-phosphate synthase large subunit